MQYEVEVKSLLGSKERATEVLAAMFADDAGMHETARQKQLNHYFTGGDLTKLADAFKDVFTPDQLQLMHDIRVKATAFNVRTWDKNGDVLLIVKGSMDERSAAHSLRRMEFEELVDMSIDELDSKVLSAGFELEAKWSADRTYYDYKGMTVDMIFSPGYGYMCEIERVVYDERDVDVAREDILAVLEHFGLQEFDNALLERMFTYYNQHWQEYYGTDKTFTLE